MPGTRDSTRSPDWFRDAFGFSEPPSYQDTRDQFTYAMGILVSTKTSKMYTAGDFTAPTLAELQERLETGVAEAHGSYWSLGGLTFQNILGDTHALHCDVSNAGAVFQASTLFNGLETTQHWRSDDGLTRYADDATQGSACAIACPAATVFRNYFYGVHGQGGPQEAAMDCLASLGEFVGNDTHGYWTMRKGYCLPRVKGSIAKFNGILASDAEMLVGARSQVQVGVQWSTEVSGAVHCVTQVLCSALPVGCVKSVRAADWAVFARIILEAEYEATLAVAAYLATRQGTRIKVYLTAVGGGMLGNRRPWIADAIDRALRIHEGQPLDVMLVHFADLPRSNEYSKLSQGREPESSVSRAATPSIDRSLSKYVGDLGMTVPGKDRVAKMASLFARMDRNGDGVIDRAEFSYALSVVDEFYFTARVIDTLIQEADADGDGVVHYSEFVAWLIGEDTDITEQLLAGEPNIMHTNSF